MVEEQFYHQHFLTAADQLISIYLEKSEREKALETTYKILRSDELWESAYRVQMRIFHEMGQLSQVRNIYFQCKRVFQEKLDNDLSPATEELYQKLLMG